MGLFALLINQTILSLDGEIHIMQFHTAYPILGLIGDIDITLQLQNHPILILLTKFHHFYTPLISFTTYCNKISRELGDKLLWR